MHDLPTSPLLMVTEHRKYAMRCPSCWQRMRAAFPVGGWYLLAVKDD